MGDLSAHFSRSEFACRGANCCGGGSPISLVLVNYLEELRTALNQLSDKAISLRINSGFRCPNYNRSIGSKDTSQHPLGLAADVAIPSGISGPAFLRITEERGIFIGIGRYDNFLHLDIRQGEIARWDNRTKIEPAHAS